METSLHGYTVHPLPIYCPYIYASEEGTTSEQWTKCSSPMCPLFGGSTVGCESKPKLATGDLRNTKLRRECDPPLQWVWLVCRISCLSSISCLKAWRHLLRLFFSSFAKHLCCFDGLCILGYCFCSSMTIICYSAC